MTLLKEFNNAHLTHLKNIISFDGKERTINLDASHIKDIARNSIAENNDVITLKIKMLIESIKLIENQLNDVNKKIEESAKKLNSSIFSIPSIGIYTGVCILSEIGNIQCFYSSIIIVGFSGMNPSTYQLRQYNAPSTALSKQGSRYLHKALYQCILPVYRFDSSFNKYYTLKRTQGISHRCVHGHAIRKLLRVIYKLLSENIKFDAELLK